MALAARFFAKVYNNTGATPRRTIDSSLFLNVPQIVREVGKPAGNLELDLALPWDDFGYGDSDGINLFDLVEIYAVNADNLGGLLVYRGHVEELEGSFSQGTNHIKLRLFPVDALLGRSLWKSGTYAVVYAAADVDTIFSDAIDDVNTIYGATFFTKNLANPALSVNVTFTRQNHLAAMQQAALFLPATWYWRVRANGQIDMQQYSDATPVHRLTVNKHIDSLRAVKSLLNVKNKILISWGGVPTDSEYLDATSQTNYGRRMPPAISDSSIGNQASSDAKGNAEIARLKDPFTKMQIVVNAEYAIETILPGDTVEIVNVTDNTSQMVSGVLRVVRVTYDGALATLDLSETVDNFGNELGKLIASIN